MYQNRPIYAIGGKSSDYVTYRTSVYEYTSFIQTPAKFEVDELSDTRSIDLFQYNVTMQQFHLFTVMPGEITDPIGTIADVDYTKLKVSIVDMTDDY